MTAPAAIDAYLREVAAGLPGRPRERGDVVAELGSGLLDALDAHRRAGLKDDDAAAAATAEFGDPRLVAATFRSELTARLARRFALTLAVTGPGVGLLWAAAASASHIGVRHLVPWGWAGTPADRAAAASLVLAGLLVTISAAVLTLAASGPLTGRPRVAAASAAVSGYGTVTVDLALFALLAIDLVGGPGAVAPVPVAVAAAASLTRLLLARRAARRCLAARAALA